MTGFSIDDVRDTLTADVTRLLGRIEATAREVLERKDLGIDTATAAVPLFQSIGDHGHAIYGTSQLVAAESLSHSAHALEELALRGRDEMARAARHLERARAITAALVSGASDMMEMLSLELEHRRKEADHVATGWRLRADEVMAQVVSQANQGRVPGNGNGNGNGAAATPPPLPPAPPPAALATPVPGLEEKWSFDEGWSAGEDAGAAAGAASEADGFSFATSVGELPVDVETGAIDAELAQIFEEEARETFSALSTQLTAFKRTPTDRKVCRDLERSFHTLKGAAATVGLAAVSERAADLQRRAESLFDQPKPPTAEFVADLIRDTEILRKVAGVRPSSAASVAPVAPVNLPRQLSEASAAVGAEVRDEFDREARALLEEAEHLVDGLADADAAAATELRRDLRKSFHRLRGSALVASAPAVADEATRLEKLCEADALDRNALLVGIARCLKALSQPSAAASRPAATSGGASGPSSIDETRAVFLNEARALYRDATALVGRVAANDGGAARENMRKLMHRLKGSALVVADEAVAREAKTLHDALTGETSAASSVQDGLARLGSLLGVAGDKGEQRKKVAVPKPDADLEAGFQQECSELLEALEKGVLALEESERPKDQITAVLRNYHTLKGVVNAMGMSPTGELVHQVEDFLELLQTAPILPPLRGVVSVLLQAHAEIRRHLKTARLGYVEVAVGRLESRLRRLLAGESRNTNSGPSFSRESRSNAHIGEGSEASGVSHSNDGPDRKNIRVSIDRLDALMNLAGELVINRSRLLSRIDSLRHLQGDLGRSSKRLIDVVEKFRDDHEFSNLARGSRVEFHHPGKHGNGHHQASHGPSHGPSHGNQWAAFSELELDKYEDVNILARSLAESSTDMQEIFGQLGNGLASLVDDSDSLGGIISGIQGEVTRARMIPLGSLFSRLQVPVRDAAQREHREVKVVTEGDDVHLDKTIVDALFQPMLHLVRNSVSHGLEAPGRRIAAGKSAVGTISLRARQELGQIVVEVFDDGGGLDLQKLHARGVAMGLIAAELPLDDPRVKDLVFAPGLSTQTAAGAVAGRGVGCDVVRRAIERLNGSIRVESVAGRNTSFLITLPLTLAITRALLVKHGGHTFAVPLYFTERIIDVQEQQVVQSAGQRRIEIDGTFVPVRQMGEFVTGGAPTQELGPVLLLRVGDNRLIVQVDTVVGQEEIVVKGLGALLTGHPMFAGVTIRGTGDIVLIIDVPSLIEGVAQVHEVRRRPERRPAARPETPAARDAAPDAAAAARPDVTAARAAAAAGGLLRVLFVDDSVSVRKVAERTLQGLGVQVTLAVDGVDALEKLHAERFDLVFTDLEMPRMHGYELIRELRFLPAFSAMPIVVITSRSGKKHREEAHALGATDYMTKPFSPQSLESALIKYGGEKYGTRPRTATSMATTAGATATATTAAKLPATGEEPS